MTNLLTSNPEIASRGYFTLNEAANFYASVSALYKKINSLLEVKPNVGTLPQHLALLTQRLSLLEGGTSSNDTSVIAQLLNEMKLPRVSLRFPEFSKTEVFKNSARHRLEILRQLIRRRIVAKYIS